MDDKTPKQLCSAIEYLCSCDLQNLAINDESADFINSMHSMPTPPIYLSALELSGKMEKVPKWIKDLNNLYKPTLSVTVLRTDTLELLRGLHKLFSLTFTLNAAKQDQYIEDILEKNKCMCDKRIKEIIVPARGFENLKLLHFLATLVPRLVFTKRSLPKKTMLALQRIDMQFEAFEGIYGIDTLESLQEVHLSVGNQADETTKSLVKSLKETTKRPKVITN